MPLVDWNLKGVEFANCNCLPGCPCQFNQLPSHGHCRAFTFVHIDSGRFGKVRLDGLNWGILAQWPGAIHHGNGMFQSIVDERADPQQRQALEAISQGRETEPGKLIWQIFSTTVTKLLPTRFVPIELKVDLAARTAEVKVPSLVQGQASSIRNPVTGADHIVKATMPQGVEFTEAEFVSGVGKGSSDGIELDFDGTHAHLAEVHWSTHGVVR